MDYKNIFTQDINIDVVLVNYLEESTNENFYKHALVNNIIINSKFIFDIKNNIFNFALNKFFSILECKKKSIHKNHINNLEKSFNINEISELILKDILLNIFTIEQLNIIYIHLQHMIKLRN